MPSITLLIDGKEHDFDPDRITFAEGAAIESAFGGTYPEWGRAIKAGSVTAMRLLVWVVLKRSQPTLRLKDLDEMTIDQLEAPRQDPAESGETAAVPT